MANKIQIRRDTASNWTSSNPTLSQGEQGYETDTGKLKIGNGSTAWTSLGYSFGAGGDTGTDYDDDVKVEKIVEQLKGGKLPRIHKTIAGDKILYIICSQIDRYYSSEKCIYDLFCYIP